jgi:hypothetical protein
VLSILKYIDIVDSGNNPMT